MQGTEHDILPPVSFRTEERGVARPTGVSKKRRGFAIMPTMRFVPESGRFTLITWVFFALLLMPGLSLGAEPGELERGVSAYRSGDYAAALRFLESAIDSNPRSAVAFYYLGLTWFATEEYEKAVAALKQSQSLDSRKSDAHLYLGMAYYHLELYEFAVGSLDGAISRDTAGPSAWLFRGLSNWKMGRAAQARSDLKKAGALEPEFTQMAEYQKAMAALEGRQHVRTGASRQAKPDRETATDPPRGRDFEYRGSNGTTRPWELELGAGLLFDDNVASSEQDVSSDESDTAAVIEVSGRYTLTRWADVEFEAGYDFYQSLYSDLADYNLQSHVFSMDAYRPGRPLDAGFAYDYLTSRIGDDALLNAHLLTATLGQAVAGVWYPNVTFKIQSREFPDDSRRDGSQMAAGLDNYIFPARVNGYLLLGMRHISEDADADYLDHRGNQVRLAMKHGFDFEGHAIEVGAEYENTSRYYRDRDPSIGEKRKDRRNIVRLNLEVRFKKNLSGFLEYEYRESDSNLPSADYRENMLTVTTRFSF